MKKPPEQKRWPQAGPSPRLLRYGWAAAVSGLLAFGLASEQQSAWMPLINHAIDLLQQQTAPTSNK
jgi:hypothetical protein